MLSGGLRTKNINTPPITIITVVRNGEETLEATILSVINQTYSNIEYIIIDGASTDGTVDIIKKYEGKIDYWISEPDKGVYDAMNKGIFRTEGGWINFLNSGDTFYNNNVINDIFANDLNEVDVVYGDLVISIENFKTIKRSLPPKKENIQTLCHQTIFVRTEVQKKYFFDLQYQIASDYDSLLKMYADNKIFKLLPIIVVDYSGDGISNLFQEKAIKEIFNIDRKNGLFISQRKERQVILIIRIKSFLKRILPKQIVNKIRKIKFQLT